MVTVVPSEEGDIRELQKNRLKTFATLVKYIGNVRRYTCFFTFGMIIVNIVRTSPYLASPFAQAHYRRMIFVIERQSVGGERRLVGTEFYILCTICLFVSSCLLDHYGLSLCTGYGPLSVFFPRD